MVRGRHIRPGQKQTWSLPKITRDTVLFTVGLVLTVNEAVWKDGTSDPGLVLLFAGMMGLPVVLWADQLRAKAGSPDADAE